MPFGDDRLRCHIHTHVFSGVHLPEMSWAPNSAREKDPHFGHPPDAMLTPGFCISILPLHSGIVIRLLPYSNILFSCCFPLCFVKLYHRNDRPFGKCPKFPNGQHVPGDRRCGPGAVGEQVDRDVTGGGLQGAGWLSVGHCGEGGSAQSSPPQGHLRALQLGKDSSRAKPHVQTVVRCNHVMGLVLTTLAFIF